MGIPPQALKSVFDPILAQLPMHLQCINGYMRFTSSCSLEGHCDLHKLFDQYRSMYNATVTAQ